MTPADALPAYLHFSAFGAALKQHDLHFTVLILRSLGSLSHLCDFGERLLNVIVSRIVDIGNLSCERSGWLGSLARMALS